MMIEPRSRTFSVVLGMAFVLSFFTVPVEAQFTQQGAKLVGTGPTGNAMQGQAVSLSSDGNTAIVGGPNDNSGVGAVWIWTRSGGAWTQQGNKLVGTGAAGAANEGYSVALSSDGNTAIAGGYLDNSNAGAVWIWTRSGSVWTQQGTKLVGTGAVGTALQGVSVALSSDGNTAIVGGFTDNANVGAAWVFTRSGSTWTQQAKLVGAGVVGTSRQGVSVALASDGSTAIIGGNGDNNVGAAWVFTRSGSAWTPQGSKLVGTGASAPSAQGQSVALSSDGNTAMVGGNNDNSSAGAVWFFTRSGSGGTWTQQGSKLVGTGAVGSPVYQGKSAALSGTGNTAIEGGYGDGGSTATGATWVFTRSVGVWTQQGTKLVGTGAVNGVNGANQGFSAFLSSDGTTTIVGGYRDNGDVGAAWVFTVPSVPAAPTGVTGSPGNAQVAVSWTAPFNGGSAITGYQVQVATSAGGTYADAAGCPTNSTTPSCTASGLANGTAYFFKVAAINSLGTGAFSSASSGVTPASFTDHPLTAGVTIKAIHINELRQRIDALRALHPPLAPYPYADTITFATTIKAQHILDLRQALLEVYQRIPQTPPSYVTSPGLGVAVVVADIASLRAAVLAIE